MTSVYKPAKISTLHRCASDIERTARDLLLDAPNRHGDAPARQGESSDRECELCHLVSAWGLAVVDDRHVLRALLDDEERLRRRVAKLRRAVDETIGESNVEIIVANQVENTGDEKRIESDLTDKCERSCECHDVEKPGWWQTFTEFLPRKQKTTI